MAVGVRPSDAGSAAVSTLNRESVSFMDEVVRFFAALYFLKRQENNHEKIEWRGKQGPRTDAASRLPRTLFRPDDVLLTKKNTNFLPCSVPYPLFHCFDAHLRESWFLGCLAGICLFSSMRGVAAPALAPCETIVWTVDAADSGS